jgi:transposase
VRRGASVTAVAADLEVTRDTVRKWRSRFLDAGLEGLADAPRLGAPRTITDEQVELVITRTLNERGPGQDTHWSTRSMAAATGMSQTANSRIWRAFGLKPHLVQTWKLSTDPEFIGKVRDIVGLYLNPPDKALVLPVDEKSQIQALDRTAPCLPILPTTPARMTHDHPQAAPLRTPQRDRARDRYPQVDHRMEQEPRPFMWTKTADEILETLAAYCRRINGSGH